jgi:hypothetical protein
MGMSAVGLAVRRGTPARHGLAGAAVALVLLILAGCAGSGSSSRGPGVTVPITDLKSVAGKWAGPGSRESSGRENWVDLTIREDGTFEIVSARQVGLLKETGTLIVSDGTLRSKEGRGTFICTLHDRGGQRVLTLDGTGANGIKYSAELRPKP